MEKNKTHDKKKFYWFTTNYASHMLTIHLKHDMAEVKNLENMFFFDNNEDARDACEAFIEEYLLKFLSDDRIRFSKQFNKMNAKKILENTLKMVQTK